MNEQRSYYALRRQSGHAATEWWRSASRCRDLPATLAPLAAGRARVELDRRDAAEALDWLESVSAESPVIAYPSDPRS